MISYNFSLYSLLSGVTFTIKETSAAMCGCRTARRSKIHTAACDISMLFLLSFSSICAGYIPPFKVCNKYKYYKSNLEYSL